MQKRSLYETRIGGNKAIERQNGEEESVIENLKIPKVFKNVGSRELRKLNSALNRPAWE